MHLGLAALDLRSRGFTKQGGWAPHSKVLVGYLESSTSDNALLGVL